MVPRSPPLCVGHPRETVISLLPLNPAFPVNPLAWEVGGAHWPLQEGNCSHAVLPPPPHCPARDMGSGFDVGQKNCENRLSSK